MGDTDPFVCLLLHARCPRPGRLGAPWGMSLGDRAGVARSYLTPDGQWHTIWRTLANPGE
ncbi:hypothetical protein GCM10009549_53360 [Streptomyces thermoalcalitolerans]|uniref:Uncharacterized protein n=1 Tax=Streptomyces thermoalcalitolerans TaxID=65605 RepID=A0ABN1PLU1_9ACTN